MRPLLLGKKRWGKRYNPTIDNHYEKEPKVIKKCGNPNCSNTFLDTPNGKKEFCHQKCLRKIRGRSDRKNHPYLPKRKYKKRQEKL